MTHHPYFGVRRILLSSFHSFHRFVRIPDALHPWRQRSASHEIKVGKRHQRKDARHVFLEARVSYFRKAPQPFDHEEAAKVQDRRLVQGGVIRKLDPAEAVHRLGVVERILGTWVGEIEPLLEKIGAHHRLQRHRRSAVAHPRVVWCDELREPRPRHDIVYFPKKPFSSRQFLLSIEGRRGKGRLLHCCTPHAQTGCRHVSAFDTGTWPEFS